LVSSIAGFKNLAAGLFDCGANGRGRAGMNSIREIKQTRGFAFGTDYLKQLLFAARFDTAIYQQSEFF